MFYVYIIPSVSDKDQTYIGATENLQQRISDHNDGKSAHTAKFLPWELECYVGFPDKLTAYGFETYLKSHSRRAFAKKRLMRSDAMRTAHLLAALRGAMPDLKMPRRRRPPYA
jgi:putative endonuclease